MPATIYYDNDADLGLLADKKVAILGYGSQGHAHALNLKDSGVDVIVGLREGSKSKAKAEEAGLHGAADRRGGARGRHRDGAAARHRAEEGLRGRHRAEPRPTATRSRSRTASTSTSTRSQPPEGVDVWMIAPKGPGHLVRRTYDEGGGVPCARRGRAGRDRQGASRSRSRTPRASARPAAACSTPRSRRRPRPTSSASRSCCAAGSSSSSATASRRSSRPGYQPESAYFETLHEVKLIVDLIYEGGIADDELLDLRHRRVRRHDPRPARRHAGDQGRDEEDPRRDPERRVRQGVDRRERGRPAELQQACARQPAKHPIEEVGDAAARR